MYPENDSSFMETTITEVRDEGNHWGVKRDDGWSFSFPKAGAPEPKPGDPARFYGRGLGYVVRGLFVNGVQVFYRTEAEDATHRTRETYGTDAAEWLRRWDEGRSVWSVEMGGIGPGYEQCIQITVAEMLRCMLAQKYDGATWEERERWQRDREAIEADAFKNDHIKALGLSGAQFGAALSLASAIYMRGPVACFTDVAVKDRLIQVSRTFPAMAA